MKFANLKTFRRAAAACVMILGLALVAYATAPTSITAQTPLGPYPGAVSAGQLALTFTAADNVNGNSFALTGHEILIVDNTDVGAQTVTITSVADSRGRTQDVTAYSMAAGTFAAFSFRGGTEGWKQSDGTVHITASAAAVKFAIIYAQ